MKKNLISMLLVGTMVAASFSAVASAEENPYEGLSVGVSWKTLQEERWVREAAVMESICEELGVEYQLQSSDNDVAKQVSQIENMVSQGVDIIIYQSNEKEGVAEALKAASEAGVLVVSYEKIRGETYADIAFGNDEYTIGTMITKAIADTGISGKVAYIYGDPAGGAGVYAFHDGMHDSMADCDVEVVGEQWTINWDPATAMGHAENFIGAHGEELAALLCMNDGTAGGAIQALENAGLAGKVLVCGQDCDLAAVQRIIAGTQYSTVLKSGNEFPEIVVRTALDYKVGNITAEDFAGVDQNSEGEDIPFYPYDGVIITKENVDTVIELGVYSHEEVYGE